MGLLKHLLFWPVTGPVFLAEFSLDKVQDVVREELTDDTSVKAELFELQLRLELGDIDDATYAAEEARLVQRLRDVREWRERFGMGVSGGLVRVAGSGQVDDEAAPDDVAPAAPGDVTPATPADSDARLRPPGEVTPAAPGDVAPATPGEITPTTPAGSDARTPGEDERSRRGDPPEPSP